MNNIHIMKVSVYLLVVAFLGIRIGRFDKRFFLRAEDPRGLSAEERCRRNPTLIFAHPRECQLYYDCKVDVIDPSFERHMRECVYPKLFDSKKNECVDYPEADCGSRTIQKDICDYRADYCEGRCTGGCPTEFPSCQNKTDGFQEHGGRPKSQYYMVCKDERLVETGISVVKRCEQDQTLAFPHLTECQLYYDCKTLVEDINHERHLRECPYPKQFNDRTYECVPYWDEDLDCGSRIIHKDICDYHTDYRQSTDCKGECRLEFPSCKGMVDGKHVHRTYQGTKYFIVCKDERLKITGWIVEP